MTISVISMVQYYSSWTNYEDAIKYIMTVPKYRIKATEIAKEDGLLKAATDKKANRGKTKEQIKEQEESVLRKVRQSAQLTCLLFLNHSHSQWVNISPVFQS